MVGQIFTIALVVWFAVRLKRHPEKDGNMKKVMSEQRGTEYEKRMQKFLMVNYLTAALTLAMTALIPIIFGLNEVFLMWILGCVLPLVFVIIKWRFIGELSKFEKVFITVWLVAWLVIGFIVYYICRVLI
jgi:cell division protein FtsL